MAKGKTFSKNDLKKILEAAGFHEKHCGNGSHIKMEHEKTSYSFTISQRNEYRTNLIKEIFKDANLNSLAVEAENGTSLKQLKKMAKQDFEANAGKQKQPNPHTSPGLAA